MVMVEMIGFDWQTKLTCFGLDLGKHCPPFHIKWRRSEERRVGKEC